MRAQNLKVVLPIIVAIFFGGFLLITSNLSNKTSVNTSPAPTKVATQKFSESYAGMLPCADCSGLDTRLVLIREEKFSGDGTFTLIETYTGKDVKPLQSKGIWTTLRGTPVDENATVYELNPDKKNEARYFLRVSDTEIRQLGNDQNEIEGDMNFTLTRIK